MEWKDEGLLLRTQSHGEASVIATFLTHSHGLIKGYLRINKKYPLHAGNIYHIKRKARLSSHLGLLTIEQHESFAPLLYAALQSPLKLACLNAIRTLIIASLVEEDTIDEFYSQVKHHISEICTYKNIGSYIMFEKDLLSHCGFSLDLTRCAVTRSQHNLHYVSPKTGRAVTKEVGLPYADQLFVLPTPLTSLEITNWSAEDIQQGLNITGYFLTRMLQEHFNRPVPPEREYLIKLILKSLE